jgi:hypothetical protein
MDQIHTISASAKYQWDHATKRHPTWPRTLSGHAIRTGRAMLVATVGVVILLRQTFKQMLRRIIASQQIDNCRKYSKELPAAYFSAACPGIQCALFEWRRCSRLRNRSEISSATRNPSARTYPIRPLT